MDEREQAQMAKAHAEAQYWKQRAVGIKEAEAPGASIGGIAGAGMALNQCQAQTAVQHPREILLADINDQEQRLLDKLVAVREIKNEFLYLGREEAERLLKVSRMADRLR